MSNEIIIKHISDQKATICKKDLVDEKICDLSNKLSSQNIYHLVLNNQKYGDYIALIEDVESELYYINNSWYYHKCIYNEDVLCDDKLYKIPYNDIPIFLIKIKSFIYED